MPETASDVLQDSIESGVSFKKGLCHNRQLTVFGPKNHTMPADYDVYYINEFSEGDVLLECMNTVMKNHLIDNDLALNACVVEKFTSGNLVIDSCVLPNILKDYISNQSPVAIFCLGKQHSVDMIPRFTSLSTIGKVEAGRMTLDHGSAAFLSKNATKLYQMRSILDINDQSQSGKLGSTYAIRLTFFC